MEDKKYKFTKETIKYDGRILHRIKALKDFGNVKKDSLGGFIEKEENLSQEGNCWIRSAIGNLELDTKVYGEAKIYDNAIIDSCSIIGGNAKIHNNAEICGFNYILGNAHIYNEAIIKDHCWIDGNCQIYGNAIIQDDSVIGDNVQIYENAIIGDHAHIDGEVKIKGLSKVSGHAHIYGKSTVSGKCWISGKAKVHDIIIDSACTINDDAEIGNLKDFMYFEGNKIFPDNLTWTRSNHTWTRCVVFHHTNEELIEMGYKRSEQVGKLFENYIKKVENLNRIKL